jgi:hypothetical protein
LKVVIWKNANKKLPNSYSSGSSSTDTLRKMSTGKWQIVNGVRYPVEGLVWENPNDEDSEWKKTDDTSFTYGGKVWDTVMEVTAE